MNVRTCEALFQVNTRVWLTQLAQNYHRPATLDDIPDTALDEWKRQGFEWIYFLGVWQTGTAAREVSRSNPEWRHEFEALLPDLKEEDICGSCFAVTGYTVHTDLGGNAAMGRLRQRLHERGLRLMLDFVPNHTAPDHPWVREHPEYYVAGTEAELERAPQNYVRVETNQGELILAYGRDPYFAGWPDTLQLNYGTPAVRAAMLGELGKAAALGDGVRCDMAMLILPDVFQRTWGIAMEPFWPLATKAIRDEHPGFVFMAEVYWDLEWVLQQQGFDYTYDKRLYDRLRDQQAHAVRDHLRADIDYQYKMARFLENHDEPRAAATFERDVHKAAAVITFLSPGLRFIYQGQFDGLQKHVSVHLCRAPSEPLDFVLREFYARLNRCLLLPAVRDGGWQLLELAPAWDGNWTVDCFVAFSWQGTDGQRLLVVANYAPNQSQCYVRIPFTDLAGQPVQAG